jgi:hypothetical protein
MTAPAVRINPDNAPEVIAAGGGWVMLRGLALADTSRAVSYVVKQGRRDGVRAPRLTGLEATLRTEVAAANGHANASDGDIVVPFVADMLSTEEAAAVMKISPRHVRRRAEELGGRRIGCRWVFDPVIVHAAATPERETND